MRTLIAAAALAIAAYAVASSHGASEPQEPSGTLCAWTLERDEDGEDRWYTDCPRHVLPTDW